MEAKIDKLLKQSIEFSRTLKQNEISLLEVLINETARLLSGKLVHDKITNTRLIWNNLKYTFKSKTRVKVPEILTSANVVIFATEPTHLKQTIPVFNLLKEELRVCFIVTKLSLHSDLKKLSVPVFFLNSSIKPFNVELRNKLKLVLPHSQLLSEFDIGLYLKNRYNNIRALIDYLEILIAQSSLKGILIGNDTTSQGKALSLICQRKRVPVYAIQHGLITRDWTHRMHSVDTFFTFGQKSKDILVENGMDQEKIIVSGAPYLDSFKPQDFLKPTVKPYILVLLSGYGHGTSFEHYQDILALLFRFFSANPKLAFVIKPHRKEKREMYLQKIAKLNLQNVRVIDEDSSKTVFDYIAESSLVITGNSYTALESMLLDKPVISIDLKNEYSDIDFVADGAVLKVTSFEMLVATFKKVYELYHNSAEPRKRILEQYYYKSDGNAAFRISAYIYAQLTRYA
jgi:UDP-N-acetylglucosamine 2-epimerase